VLDLNHPLAGHPLLVTLQVVTIENPEDGDNNTVTGKGDHPDLVIVVHPKTVRALATNTLKVAPVS
jgi:FKBP-type peptidyl-prolyl cis-trans isomerase 2